jgi:hypothetical protein
MARKSRDPFDVPLSKEQRETFAHWICEQLQDGLSARATQDTDVDYWHRIYEQARTRTGRQAPWVDAADLTTYLAAEKVDAIVARAMRTIFVDPIWTVEGWGDATDRAPFVEEFHQWKAEEERLQSVIDRLLQISLIEPRGLLEVYEGTEYRTVRKTIQAAVEMDPMTGGLVYGEDGQPSLQRGEDGQIVEAKGEQAFAAVTVVDVPEPVRVGPCYRVIPYRDSAILPGHARDQAEIWAYFKRFWRRLPDIQRNATGPRPIYDAEAVKSLTNVGDREPDAALSRSGMAVAPQDGVTSEKELWEGLVLVDLDALMRDYPVGKVKPELRGARWYLVTIHLGQQVMLRIQHDDIERSRFLPVILFPRTDRVTEGLSLVGHKLITTCEEHTAWRNMAADRAAMVVQAPVKRLTGALWDPEEQPWGPRAVIDVRDMKEVEPVTVPDLTQSVFQHIQMVERNAERIVGVNDIAAGQVSEESRTLGEVQMATAASEVRMDLIIRRFQEVLEDLAQIRHVIWKRTLAEKPDGVDVPASLIGNLEGRGVSIDAYLPEGKITAALLDGAFRFKPKGSVETADKGKQRQSFANALQMLPALLGVFPMLGPMFQTPQAARAMGRYFLHLFNIPSPQAFLGSPSQDLLQQQQLNMIPPASAIPPPMMGPPGMPGQPPGGPSQGDPIQGLAAQLAAKFGHPPPGLVQGPQRPQ